ncbi:MULTISPECIES: WD40 repeat domain-containing protein [unclassified Tolypothrix]|uniref:WD40 repeat domain-containing protein n=1 Tax=unclassified Tolypothrix TaxID=2649714 RepID=UPI0005EAA3E6|nr:MULTISPECIES: WD40 repeat domain-containing protein [unclassified Tolypothrix]BAY92063.1 WD-40 repeat-containing protein [Microchaete diplosiphon NIES-3275]EKF04738.1 WD domain, G-beta repeat protein [Tolypothrix sp. PCC 7601]MBE9081732.1 WD40 repeat domain-containing protein [Tolypothrix sp. LEGE 11397]UYD26049.1 WD40 repeat domain-containing protein [Tolypothrix sp. PCC 7712]UYD31711.1 WD40 repeat domain-containing protein [Tolypothrix sp. PCC 7601]
MEDNWLNLQREAEKRAKYLSINLLSGRKYQVLPNNPIDIKVGVRNSNPKPVEVILRFVGLDASWLKGSRERKLVVPASAQAEIIFQCQPPPVKDAPSEEYPFTIEAITPEGYSLSAQGYIEVLPVGFVKFAVTPQKLQIPHTGKWLPNWKSHTGSFELIFNNLSNLQQSVYIQVQGQNTRRFSFQLLPETLALTIQQITTALLEIKAKRPWIGWSKRLKFTVRSRLLNQRLQDIEPTSQDLELLILPIIPIWLQLVSLAVILGLLSALLSLILNTETPAHTEMVNAVRLNNNADLVVSGAEDGTIKFWRVDGESLHQLNQPESEDNSEPVLALEFASPENQLVAAGLDNGVTQLWNIKQRQKINELSIQEIVDNKDRVFTLAFTKDNHYLIAGHGSGNIVIWVNNSAKDTWQLQPERVISLGGDYEAWSMALSEDENTLAITGNKKLLTLLDFKKINRQPQSRTSLTKEYLTQLDIIKAEFSIQATNSVLRNNDRILNLNFLPGSSQLLATADSDGFVTILDYQCQSQTAANKSEQSINQNCIIDQWAATAKRPIRGLLFREGGTLAGPLGTRQLVISDDERVTVWQLTPSGKRENTTLPGKEIFTSHNAINSIDINSQGTKIVSGGEECHQQGYDMKHCWGWVTLRRLQGK